MKNQKEAFKKLKRGRQGITLIALVVTIIVLLILAAVAINLTIGNNGIFKRAQETTEKWEQASNNEQNEMDKVIEEIDKLDKSSFEPHLTPEPPTGGEKMKDMTNGVIEIRWLRGKSNNVSNTPNAPVIKKEGLPNGTTMEQVVFNEQNKTWESGSEYSYVKGNGSEDNNSSKWANAKVTIDGLDSYFVWIPRYAYRIIYFDNAESKKAYQEKTLTEEEAIAKGKIIGYSDSRGIVDKEGKKIDDIASTTKIMVSEDYFMLHPAFSNNVENGGWTSELSGLWIGKYETALADSVGEAVGYGDKIKIQPGVNTSIPRYRTIGIQYTFGKEFQKELESHMLKNSEWGAIAYLTESTYGRNGNEITKNSRNENSKYLAGGGLEDAYVNNTNQSSTGNVYGIYDLSGGNREYVACYYNGPDANPATLEYGSPFAVMNRESDAYSTSYNGIESVKNYYKYGDATLETQNWHNDNRFFMSNYSLYLRSWRNS